MIFDKLIYKALVSLLGIFLLTSTQTSWSQTYSDVSVTGLTPLGFSRSEWADLNNDGNLDFIIAGEDNVGTDFFRIFLNNGDGTFSNTTGGLPVLSEMNFVFGDIDGDQDLDAVISGRNGLDDPVLAVYYNSSSAFFTNAGFMLTPQSGGDVALGDLDNDGDQDLIVTGRNASSATSTTLYLNQANTIIEVPSSLPDVTNGEIVIFDADQDGINDILLTGLGNVGNRISDIYFGQGDNGVYTAGAIGITPTAFNDIAVGDFDENGFTDIIVTGSGNSGNVTAYYLNTGGVFILEDAGFEALSSSDVATGDLNNDGLLDIYFTGLDADGFFNIQYYRSSTAGNFNLVSNPFENLINGDLSLGDFDNDGTLDVLRSGVSELSLIAALARNDLATKNTVPTSPAEASLSSTINEDTVVLSWSAASDTETSSQGLYYNLYLRNLTTGEIIAAPESDLTNGFRKVVGLGNVGSPRSRTFSGISEGNYEWALQSIDNNFSGSAFTALQNFQICTSVNIGSDTTICVNESIDLQAGTASDVVNWFEVNNGALSPIASNTNGITVTILETDSIVAQVSKPFGCMVQDTIIIEAIVLPDVDLGADQNICFDELLSLEVDIAFDSVNWFSRRDGLLFSNQNSIELNVIQRDTIIAEVFNASRCVNYDTLIVDVIDLPSFSIGADENVCFEETLALQVDLSFPEVNWFSANRGLILADMNALDFVVLERDTIIAEVFNSAGCVNYDTLIVDVLPLPAFDLGEDVGICFNENVRFELDPAFDEVNWFSKTNGLLLADETTFETTVTVNDTLIAEVFNSNRCVQYDTVVVRVLDLPVFDIGEDTSRCFGEDILLSVGTGFDSTNWFLRDGTTLELNSFFYTHNVSRSDTIIAEVFSRERCVNYDTIIVESIALPSFTLGDDFDVCAQDVINLSVDNMFDSVNWFSSVRGLLLANAFSLSTPINEPDTIWAEVFNAFGCVNYDTIAIATNPLPVFDLANETSLCVEDILMLDVGDGWDEVNWFSANTGFLISDSQLSYEIIQDDTLTVEVFSTDRCLQRDTVIVTALALPVFDLGETISTCDSDSITLSVSDEFATVRWQSLNNGLIAEDTFQIDLVVQGNDRVWAEVTNNNGCLETDTVDIVGFPLPVPNAGEDQLICPGVTAQLGEMPIVGFTYEWLPITGLDDANSANPIAMPTETTEYILKVTTGQGCISFDSVLVEVNPANIINAGTDRSICLGDQLILGGEPTAQGSTFPYRYQWTPTESLSDPVSPNPIAQPSQTTTYQLTVFTGDCLEETADVTVTVNDLPEITVTQDTTIGSGEIIVLQATGGELYDWTPTVGLNIPTLMNPSASPLSTTTYTVTVTDDNQCQSSGQVTVFVENRLFIPNLFTPNDDGQNDNFLIFGDGIKSISFRIFDRRGELIYETSNVDEAQQVGWDGRFKGRLQDSGNYVWSLQGEFFDGTALTFEGKNNGTIRLLR